MADNIKVSVILTSYAHAKYLREAIDSVLRQTFVDYELIIWDDASTDDSWAIIQSYKDKRIRAFRNEVNQYGVDNINRAISEEAKGPYIAIHHSDDVWEPQKLEKQVRFLDDHPEIGAVFTNAAIIGEQGEPFENKSHFYFSVFDQPNRSRHEWLNHFFYRGNALCHPSILIRKVCYDQCGLYRYGLVQLPDYDMWVRLCLKYEIYVMPEKLVRFRVRDNMANTSSGLQENHIRGQFEFLQLLDHYCNISTYEEMVEVFPVARKYYHSEGFDAQYVLAMIALEAHTYQVTELFGLRLLFDALNCPIRARIVKELYDFDMLKFKELSGAHNVFSLKKTQIAASLEETAAHAKPSAVIPDELSTCHKELVQCLEDFAQWKEEFAKCKEDLGRCKQELAQREGELALITGSRFWRFRNRACSLPVIKQVAGFAKKIKPNVK